MTNVDPSPSRHAAPSRPVWEQVLDEIRRLIVLGELAPGERLVETTLAHHFGVSRGPIRTALMTLEQSGLVRTSDRRGVEVADYSSSDIAELFAVRTALEALAVRGATERRTPAMLERLRSHVEDLETFRAQHMTIEAAEADLAFHEEICANCGNHLLLVTWTNLADALAVVMTRMYRERRAIAPIAGHLAILQSMEAGDADKAEVQLRSHLAAASTAYQSARDTLADTGEPDG